MSKKPTPATEDKEIAKARAEGRKAYAESLPTNACPYPDGEKRLAWIEGWYEKAPKAMGGGGA